MPKIFLVFLIIISNLFGQSAKDSDTKIFPLESVKGLQLINVKADIIEFDGKKGLQISKIDGEITDETLVIIQETHFINGTIEIELSGEPAVGEDPQMRGFVGVAFRVNPSDPSSYECFYLRPANGRADTQIQRNHSTQYVSHPEFPWYRLRDEDPGEYESYVDLVPGKWTKLKIEVDNKKAKLYVNDAPQPCLIVNDLKHEVAAGKVALWLHASTLARFRNLVISSK